MLATSEKGRLLDRRHHRSLVVVAARVSVNSGAARALEQTIELFHHKALRHKERHLPRSGNLFSAIRAFVVKIC